MRLKQFVSMVSSEVEVEECMCAYSREATAPPAECPVIRREEVLREGFSCRSCRRREEIWGSMRLATVRKPEWQRLPGSS